MDRGRYQEYTFNNRIRPKEPEPSFTDIVKLPNKRMAFIYQRLSSHEQVKKSIFSIKMQDGLVDLAEEDGYPDDLIHTERRDLGISGTVGEEKREGLAYLIQMIEADKVEAVYVVQTSRLYRDQTLIDGLTFAQLCKKHNVLIVMPNMRLNLRDKMHMRMFRIELERAADELEMMSLRLGGAREIKAKQGFYAAGMVPLGFAIDMDKDSDTFEKYVPHKPHAKIVAQMFEMIYESDGSTYLVAKQFQREDKHIPFFPPELAHMNTRSGLQFCKRHEHGYIITPRLVRNTVTNPTMIGGWIWGGELIRWNNHSAVVDENLFWAVQGRMRSPKRRGKAVWSEPLPLAGLLYCGNHDEPGRIVNAATSGRYLCCTDYKINLEDGICLCVADWILDIPICDFVISQCTYPEYTDEILKVLSDEYEKAKSKADAHKRAHARLTREIENLKENLSHTRTQSQVEMILEMIEEKVGERKRLAEIEAYPVGRTLSAAEVENVTDFLSNIHKFWKTQSPSLKNEFLRIVLDRIILWHYNDDIRARIIWRSGLEQEILIHRPRGPSHVARWWAQAEDRILKENYSTSTQAELEEMLPKRTWSAIVTRAKGFGLKRKRMYCSARGEYRRWTEEEDELVRALYTRKITIDELVEKTGRTRVAITARRRTLGLGPLPESQEKHVEWEVVDSTGMFPNDQIQELGHLKTLALETLDQDTLIGLTEFITTLTGYQPVEPYIRQKPPASTARWLLPVRGSRRTL